MPFSLTYNPTQLFSKHSLQDSESDDGKTPGGAGASGGGSGGGSGNAPNDGDLDAVGTDGRWWLEDGTQFPPRRLLGPASDSTVQPTFAAAARRGEEGGGSSVGGNYWQDIHPMVARRGLDFLWYLCKTSFRVTYDMLTVSPAGRGDGVLAASPQGGKRGAARESKGYSGKGKGKGRAAGSSGKGQGNNITEAMDVAAGTGRGGKGKVCIFVCFEYEVERLNTFVGVFFFWSHGSGNRDHRFFLHRCVTSRCFFSCYPFSPILSHPLYHTIPFHPIPSHPIPDDSALPGAGSSSGSKGGEGVLLEQLMDLLGRPLYTMSGPDLDDLLQLIEVLVAPLANLKEVNWTRNTI